VSEQVLGLKPIGPAAVWFVLMLRNAEYARRASQAEVQARSINGEP